MFNNVQQCSVMFSNVPQGKVPSMVPYWVPMLYFASREQNLTLGIMTMDQNVNAVYEYLRVLSMLYFASREQNLA